MLLKAHIDLYVDSPYQASVSYLFSSIGGSVNTEADADEEAWCGRA